MFIATLSAHSQIWVDSLYSVNTIQDISYGSSIDFGGREIDLRMDISFPIDDSMPECGRPLLVAIHGGAWLSGSKQDGTIMRLCHDFASKGYVAVAVDYRLGLFQTDRNIHCNVENWDCLNMADSSEWYRAYFRSIQDAHGAIRYLVNNSDEYGINPDNIFIIGESAGGFTAMGVGFLDSEDEVLVEYTGELGEVKAPNQIYEKPCLIDAGLADSIEEQELTRPSLGSYKGTLNFPLINDYKIRGVGSFYGGLFNNIIRSDAENVPALYCFHQPNDMIVPIDYGRVFEGYSKCTQGFPLNCQNIINRISIFGSDTIEGIIEQMKEKDETVPDFVYERTTNKADCLEQLTNPVTAGHQLDNYKLRLESVAKYFSLKIADCNTDVNSVLEPPESANYLYPNPLPKGEMVTLNISYEKVQVYNLFGKMVLSLESNGSKWELIDSEGFESGLYIVYIFQKERTIVHKLIVN